ncbi:MAG TPA: UDP-glucose 4-epimerase GalE [Acidimicrobiales bacterium]|nr:UDP-glucose 4-epimerase GalE [Acidimicrobiales bacterium]
MARLLVSGGAGYIGSHTCRALTEAGHQVVVLDDLSAGHAVAVNGLTLVEGDVGDAGTVEEVWRYHGPIDGVVHFAGFIEVGRSISEPLAFYDNNLLAASVLLEAAVNHKVRAFVFSSTAAVYGTPEVQPIPEDAPIAPINPYGRSKAMLEAILADVDAAHGLPWAALRYFNACGAHPDGDLGENHEPETHLIPLALAAAAGRLPKLDLYGTDYPTPDGTCVRDYIHVQDLALAHVLAVEGLLGGRSGGPFNLGTGRGYSNREVLEAVERVVGRPVPVVEASRRDGDPAVLVADSSRFTAEFGWEPRFSDLDTIIESAWRWHQRTWNVMGLGGY